MANKKEMTPQQDFDERFKKLCLLTRTTCTEDLTNAYFQKLRYYEFQDFDYACRQLEENDVRITLKLLLRYIFESKNRYKITRKVNGNSLFAEESIKNCNHQCKTCSLTEAQSCKELSLAMLCYTRAILTKKLTITEADKQLRSDFPKMSFPHFADEEEIQYE